MEKIKITVLIAVLGLLGACAGGQVQEPNAWDPLSSDVQALYHVADAYVTYDVSAQNLKRIIKKITGSKADDVLFYQLMPGPAEAGFSDEGFVLKKADPQDNIFKQYWELKEPLRPTEPGECSCYRAVAEGLGEWYFTNNQVAGLLPRCGALSLLPSQKCYRFMQSNWWEEKSLANAGPLVVLSRFYATETGYIGAPQTMLHGYVGDGEMPNRMITWVERIGDGWQPTWFINVVYASQQKAPLAIVASGSLLAVEEASEEVLKRAGVTLPVAAVADNTGLLTSMIRKRFPYAAEQRYGKDYKKSRRYILRALNEKTGHPRLIYIN